MAGDRDVPAWVLALLGLQVFLGGVLATLCLWMPQALLGDSAWLPFERFTAQAFGASLVVLVLSWAGALRAGERARVSSALLGVFMLFALLPLLLGLNPGVLDSLDKSTPLSWWGLLVAFIFLGAVPAFVGRLALKSA